MFRYVEPREITCPTFGQQVQPYHHQKSALRLCYMPHKVYTGKLAGKQCPGSDVEVRRLVPASN